MKTNPTRILRGLPLLALAAGLALSALTTAAAAAVTEVKLAGLRVRIGEPIQVAAQLAWEEGPNHRWVMNHPVPSMARFPSGEILVSYSLVSDYNDNPRNFSGLQLSKDGGKTWSRRLDFVAEHQAMIYTPVADSSLLGIPAYLYATSPGETRNFDATYTRLELGGGRAVLEPHGVKVVDWPWDLARPTGYGFFGPELVQGIAPRISYVPLCFDGNAVQVGGRLLATGYCLKQGDTQYRNVILASEDQGRTWRYLSTVADATGLPPEAEGPNEISMIQLADGDLMTVFRVGGGRGWNLRRAYSHDQGRTWSAAEAIPAFSVEPSLLRTANGTIALSTGRPGIRLWLSTDARAEKWQDIDIVDIHNRWAPDPTYRIGTYQPKPSPDGVVAAPAWQTSSYTEIVEVAPNRLLLVYDRSAKPSPENNGDLTRIFVLPIEIVRD
ncbi:MAG: hypothetical protein JWM88_2414 [Verrucomicrobia bacterium]|nr:hypothetical protein [Verrucomicrobiota bacterium]